ncbi:hypothetical protein I5907_09540 [Panacibacter sp. DH6]|uniref:Uncharacterized protein n=1 Tax=Panacibacter microcysteis TaxID=2793269 RepID=A0A931E728_9BACT|nr:hypothetical protein [Panacibacter microcysteis]MBG9376475.1 hypothetical protein [Panacibacter microcysteis]
MTYPLLKKIRILVVFFIIALAISGITAFPVYTELTFLKQQGFINTDHVLGAWLDKVYNGVADTYKKYPFLFYGYDWLAFAHLMIAALFYGVYRDPVRNKFIMGWGMFCCVCIIPLAFICGTIRSIPLYHILIDCSFGVFGIIPLLVCRKYILQLEALQNAANVT